MYYNLVFTPSIFDLNELYHHGIKGQRWGFRKYQNSDGSLTPMGRLHYGYGEIRRNVSMGSKQASKFMSSLNGKGYGDIKNDVLDYANRKGVLDFLDSKADAPFKAINTGTRYVSESAKNPFKAMSNIDRYTDFNNPHRATKQHEFTKAMDKYNGNLKSKNGYKDWSDALGKMGAFSSMDKKYSSISKSARDIDRETKTKSFIDDLSKGKWDVGKLSSKWYKTDSSGRKEQFKGDQYLWEKGKDVKVPKYKTIVTPEHTETSSIKRIRTYPGQKGIYDANNKFIPFDKNGVAYEKYTRTVPKSTEVVRDGWKLESTIIPKGINPEYKKWEKSMKMPSDYSHLVKDVGTIKRGGDFLDDYLSMKHSALNELYHHGTKGQKWGNRKYQNSDGSLTPMGRIHYGVGKARDAASSAGKKLINSSKNGLGKVGNAVRKTVKPTDEELLEKYNKSKSKYDRAMLKAETKRLKKEAKYVSGKKKKLKDMSDEEIQNKIKRLQNEAHIKKLEKESKQSNVGKFMDNYIKNAIGQGLGYGISNGLQNRVADMLGPKKDKKYSDLFREQEAKLKLDVLSGDSKVSNDAAEKLKNLRNATSKKNEKDTTKKNDSESNGRNSNTTSKKNNNESNSGNRNDTSKKNSDKRNKKEKGNNVRTYSYEDYMNMVRNRNNKKSIVKL